MQHLTREREFERVVRGGRGDGMDGDGDLGGGGSDGEAGKWD
jgi:hypothetical protein